MNLNESISILSNSIVAHPHLQNSMNELEDALADAEQGDIIFLYGPTGVGKTTLLIKLIEKITNQSIDEDKIAVGEIPCVRVSAAAGHQKRSFSWRELFFDLIKELLGENIRPKYTSASGRIFEFNQSLRTNTRTTEVDLINAINSGFALRNVKTLIIDEAQDIANKSDHESIETQLNYLKGKSNNFKPTIVLAGTYDLIAFLNLSGQLSRRSHNIHFPRYDYSNPGQLEGYIRVLNTYQQIIPKESLSLIDHLNDLYIGSAGCIGIVHRWMIRACKKAVKEGRNHLLFDDLKAKSLKKKQLEKIALELAAGEQLLLESADMDDRIKMILGMQQGTKPSEPQLSPKKAKLKPGQRKPHRDPVGSNK